MADLPEVQAAAARRVFDMIMPAILALILDGRGWHTSEAVPRFVAALKKKGYRFVTVSQLLAAGRPVAANSCYELKPGDNVRYDKILGRGTGDRPAMKVKKAVVANTDRTERP